MTTALGKGLGPPWQGGGRPNTPAVTSGGRSALLPVDSGPPPGVKPPGPGNKGNFAKDPDFNNVVLLLPSDGADAAEKTVDWSLSPHASTRVGTAQLDTAQKKFGTASMLFDGNSDEYTFVDHPDWDLSGDFTVELWVRFNSVAANQTFIGHYTADSSQRAWRFHWTQSTEKLVFIASDDGTLDGAHQIYGVGQDQAAWSPVVDRWYHLAFTREKNTGRIYVDGKRKVKSQFNGTIFDANEVLIVGADGTNTDKQYMNGWIDDVRITVGEAIYTKGSYKVPKAAHDTSAAGASDSDYLSVVALLPYNSTDGALSTSDFSQSGHAISFNGGSAIDTARKQFGVSSLLLDGSTADDNSSADSADWDFGSGDFTVEAWINWDVFPDTAAGYIASQWSTVDSQRGWLFRILGATKSLGFGWTTGGTSATQTVESSAADDGFTNDTWHHVAVVRDGNTIRLFVDGTETHTIDITGQTIHNSTRALFIGTTEENGSSPLGEDSDVWIDDLRITKGVARYTANFSVPTEAHPTHN